MTGLEELFVQVCALASKTCYKSKTKKATSFGKWPFSFYPSLFSPFAKHQEPELKLVQEMNARNPGYSVLLLFVKAANRVYIFGVRWIEKIGWIEIYLNIVNSWFA